MGSLTLNTNSLTFGATEIKRVFAGIYEADSPISIQPPKALSLPHLLRTEALSGITHERDPQALRPDYYYFAARNFYVLVEDSTGEHKTVVVKEYEKPRRNAEAEWPILHGGVEGRGAFVSKESNVPPLPFGTVPIPLPAFQAHPVAYNNSKSMPPPATAINRFAANAAPVAPLNSLRKTLLKKAADQRQIPAPPPEVNPSNDEAHGFLAASGNSQIISSTIASMTSGAVNPVNHPQRQDQRLTMLDRRQVITQNAFSTARVGLGVPAIKPKPLPKLKRARRTNSVQAGLQNPNPEPPYEAPKPGYCENCRLRYDDFRVVGPLISLTSSR